MFSCQEKQIVTSTSSYRLDRVDRQFASPQGCMAVAATHTPDTSTCYCRLLMQLCGWRKGRSCRLPL